MSYYCLSSFINSNLAILGMILIMVQCAPFKQDASWHVAIENQENEPYITPPTYEQNSEENGNFPSEEPEGMITPEEDPYPEDADDLESTSPETTEMDKETNQKNLEDETSDSQEDRYTTESSFTSHESSSVSYTELYVMLQKNELSTASAPEAVTNFNDKAELLLEALIKSNRQSAINLQNLKKLLLRWKSPAKSNVKQTQAVKIRINAETPLQIKAEVKLKPHKKVASKKEKFIDTKRINTLKYEKSGTFNNNPIQKTQESDEDLEAIRRQFIKKGAEFLRHAWNDYLAQRLFHKH